MLSGWVIRKDPGRLGHEVELRGAKECFVYLLSLLGSLAWFWCNRSCFYYLCPVRRNVWVLQNIYLMGISHSVAHVRKMLAFSLHSSSVFKSFGHEVYVNVQHLLPGAAKQLSWLCCC